MTTNSARQHALCITRNATETRENNGGFLSVTFPHITLDSIPILMKLPMMVNMSLTMSRMYQPLMNSILSPQLTLRPRPRLKNCAYSWLGGTGGDDKNESLCSVLFTSLNHPQNEGDELEFMLYTFFCFLQ